LALATAQPGNLSEEELNETNTTSENRSEGFLESLAIWFQNLVNGTEETVENTTNQALEEGRNLTERAQ
jgi:hypothetical protein